MPAKHNHRKITQALNFFAIQEGGPINKMKALKLLWLADRLHLRRYGRTITNDTYYALRNGPVASTASNIASNDTRYLSREVTEYSKQFVSAKTQRKFESVATVDEKVFSQTDRDALREVYEEFGKTDEEALSELSHHYPEWMAFEEQLIKAPGSRHEMSLDDFFRNTEISNRLFAQDTDVLELSREMFHEPW
jgi:uncharacterized phage-associated protein